MLKAFVLFTVTAAAEIFGCYAVYLWLRLHKPAWWLLPGAVSLVLFAWLLTLHPQVGAGRVYAAVWRRLCRRVAGVAVGRGRTPARPLGCHWITDLSDWDGGNTVRATELRTLQQRPNFSNAASYRRLPDIPTPAFDFLSQFLSKYIRPW